MDHAIDTGEEAGEVTFGGGSAPNDDLTFFLLGMFLVVEVDGVFVVENGRGFTKCDAVLGFVARGFVFIPFELEGFLFFHDREYSM